MLFILPLLSRNKFDIRRYGTTVCIKIAFGYFTGERVETCTAIFPRWRLSVYAASKVKARE